MRQIRWQNASLKLVEEILREAELVLQAQLTRSIAAEQKYALMASIFTAAASVLAAALVTAPPPENFAQALPMYAGGGIAVFLLIAGSLFCVWAVWPGEFFVPGNDPVDWYDDVDASPQRDLTALLGEQIEIYQSMIDDNQKILTRNSLIFMIAVGFAAASPLAAFLVWAALRLYLN